jgi:hypothetical protein
MLKITNNHNGGVTTIKLEGKLAGVWVNELMSCWQQAILTGDGKAIRIDLAGVTWVNDEGKALLGAMHRNGAELLAANLLMAGIVAEISAETI